MKERLSYWVFTSGEKGVHGLDWGIKHSSPDLGDMPALDVEYRALLKDFSLPPRLRRPEDDTGLIVLPYGNGYILGFIFAGTDHGGRQNTSSVIAVIPGALAQSLTVNDAVRDIWRHNRIADIARRHSEDRTEYLAFAGEVQETSEPPEFAENFRWPDKYHGMLQTDVEITVLEMPHEVPRTPKRNNSTKIFALIAVIIAVLAGGYMFAGCDTPTIPEQPESLDTPPIPEPQPESMDDPIKPEPPAPAPAPQKQQKTSAQIMEELRSVLGDMRLGPAEDGFQFTADRERLPLERWHIIKEEILDELAVNIRESGTGKSYRIIFRIPGFKAGTYGFNECIDAFLSYYMKEE